MHFNQNGFHHEFRNKRLLHQCIMIPIIVDYTVGMQFSLVIHEKETFQIIANDYRVSKRNHRYELCSLLLYLYEKRFITEGTQEVLLI